MDSSQDSLPSPDRVPNLWRYGQTPPKSTDPNVEESDLMDSESNTYGGGNLCTSGTLEDFSSAREMSGGQMEQEPGGDLFSLRRQAEDVSAAETCPRLSQRVGQSTKSGDQEQEKGEFSGGENTAW